MGTMMNAAVISDREFENYRRKCRRQRQIRRHIFLMVLGVVLVLISVISFHVIVSDAGTDTEGLTFKYYTSVLVSPGDSLWSIAQSYLDDHYEDQQKYISEVVSINHLQDDSITSGQYLIVPYYSEEFVK